MRLFNSKTNQLETFKPIETGKVKMYVCGPTVYDEIHIGNARPIIVFDTLRRIFEAQGYEVDMVSNYTDVDDKIINKAISEKVDEKTITDRNIKAYNVIKSRLNTRTLSASLRVTETMDEIIAFIKALVDEGYAYNVNGNVYFRVLKSENYGEISKQRIDDLLVGARVEEDPEKESPIDFSLWKKTEIGIQWDSPWGKGRPGWHTECVVMIDHHFHGKIDIHGGGMDLKFPHHENELAQAKACYHHDLANVWMHNGMLNIDGEKMSKSIGNVLSARDVIDKVGANTVRWMMLSVHYRSPLNISEEVIEQAKTELQKAQSILTQVEIRYDLADQKIKVMQDETFVQQFIDAVSDDLNTPNGMKIIFDVIKALNQDQRQKDISEEILLKHYGALRKILDILGIAFKPIVLTSAQKDLFVKWNQAKADKDFNAADLYRKALIEQQLL
ncbi:MAG: cysteinyl-tRNA [Erysipelotrichaceae bacterium]|nr:MAG: cysteinyl-tRNA [Erysipelotrichaceae bacterium]